MKKILIIICTLLIAIALNACGNSSNSQVSAKETETPASMENVQAVKETATAEKLEAVNEEQNDTMIKILTENGNEILIKLYNSSASKTLAEQLPMNVETEDYGNSEKIFYPKEKLDVSDASLAAGPAGIVTYYEPWGDVAIFYEECNGASGLYELGEVVAGMEYLKELSGEVSIEKAN